MFCTFTNDKSVVSQHLKQNIPYSSFSIKNILKDGTDCANIKWDNKNN